MLQRVVVSTMFDKLPRKRRKQLLIIIILTTSLATSSLAAVASHDFSEVQNFELETDDYVRATVLKERIRYLLYDRSTYEWVELNRNGTQFPDDVWIPEGKVKMVTHGFSSYTWDHFYNNLRRQKILQIGEAYGNLEKDKLNIIVVDWSSLATVPVLEYPLAARSVRIAGLDYAEFLVRLKSGKFIKSLSDVHLIGFSLGAHVMGSTGYFVQALTGGEKVGRITGLDPAGPEFDVPGGKMPKDKVGFLEKNDAKFVDIIHCNMGTPLNWVEAPLIFGRLGSFVQAGHADFYPNGGETQTDCNSKTDRLGCSHLLCPKYFLKSITKDYLACPCNSWRDYQLGECSCGKTTGGQMMGSRCDPSARGRYYLDM